MSHPTFKARINGARLDEGWEARLAEPLANALEKKFDRSFTVTINKVDGRIEFDIEEKDTGSPVMTVQDVAVLLQVNRSTVYQMCKTRAQQGPHPIPFTKIHGRMLRFDRAKIMNWIATTPGRPKRGTLCKKCGGTGRV